MKNLILCALLAFVACASPDGAPLDAGNGERKSGMIGGLVPPNGTSSGGGGGTGDITAVIAGTGLTGGATSGDATLTVGIVGGTCGASQAVTSLSATGTATCGTVGDITGVIAGTGLSGGGTSGGVTLTADTAVVQSRVTGTCTTPNAVASVGSDGTVTCTTGVLNTSNVSGTTSTMPKFTGTNTIGNSSCTDDGTTFAIATNKFTVTEASGNTAVAGTLGVTGAATMSSTLGVTGATTVGELRGTLISPTGLTGTMSDWAPTGISTATIIHATLSGNTSLTGITTGAAGRRLTITNLSGGVLTFVSEATSTTTNRFTTPEAANWPLRIGGTVELYYDGTTQRWIVEGWTRVPQLTVDATMAGLAAVTVGTTLTVSGASTLGDAQADTTTIWGHVIVAGTAPALTSCGGSPSIVGTDQQGTVTVGSAATGCVITFNTACATNASMCVVTSQGGIVFSYSTSTTAITLTAIGTLSSTLVDYSCKCR